MYALAIVIAELAMGGFGAWLVIDWGSIQFPVRMVFFTALMGGWGAREALRAGGMKALIRNITCVLNNHGLRAPAVSLFFAIVWGMGWGFFRKNSYEAVLLDANGWWYWALLFPLLAEIKEKKQLMTLFSAALGASLAASLLTLAIYILFINNYEIAPDVYRWVRDTRLGELTPLFPHGWRVFMQSQVWALIVAGWGIARFWRFGGMEAWREKVVSWWAIIFSLIALIISLSRSYWIGLTALCATFFVFFYLMHTKSLLRMFVYIASAFLVSGGLVYGVQYIALRGERGYPLVKRLNIHEPAGTSRMNQLPPLARAIAQHPIVGSGFGTTVTYKSLDPRIVASTAGSTGVYTTFAFEWGYLDMWLKIGLVGLAIYLWFIASIMRRLYGYVRMGIMKESLVGAVAMSSFAGEYVAALTMLCALVAVACVHITSPYLNHPLGIGVVLLSSLYALRFGSPRNS